MLSLVAGAVPAAIAVDGEYSRVLLAGLALAVSPARLRNVDHFSIDANDGGVCMVVER